MVALKQLLFSLGWIATLALTEQPLVYQPGQMQSDLEAFKVALINIHPGTYTHQSPEEFEDTVEQLKRAAAAPLPALEFYKLVLKLIASIHDGHTQAYATGALGRQVAAQKKLPFHVYVAGERIFVRLNLSDYPIPVGSEILSLDGRTSARILGDIATHYSGDGLSRNGMWHRLAGPYHSFNRLYPEIYEEKPVHELIYRNAETGQVSAAQIAPVSDQVLRARLDNQPGVTSNGDPVFALQIDHSRGAAVMRVSRFFKDSYDEPESVYQDFYRESFRRIQEAAIDTLVVDLRDNGGGKVSNAAYLLQYFIEKPVRPATRITTLGGDDYFEPLTGKKMGLNEAFGLQPMSNGRAQVTRDDVLRDLKVFRPIKDAAFDGNLFVLVNGGTSSAGAIAAGLLKAHAKAVLVGEETFGYAGISNGVRQVSIKGRHTETAIYLPILHAQYNVHSVVGKRAVVPDIPVHRSVRDVVDGKDRALGYLLEELIPKRRALQSND